MPKRVVILSSHSLFADGIASRLHQYPMRVDVHFVNPQQQDYVEQITTLQPAAVIMAAAETETSPSCVLCELLTALENVTIVRLEVQQKDIRVITSEQRQFEEVRDILEILDQSPRMLGI